MMIQNKQLRTYLVVLHELTEHVVQVEASSIEEASYNAEDGWKEGWYCDENATLLELTTVRSKKINEEKA